MNGRYLGSGAPSDKWHCLSIDRAVNTQLKNYKYKWVEFRLLTEELKVHHGRFRVYFRMSVGQFGALLKMLAPQLKRQSKPNWLAILYSTNTQIAIVDVRSTNHHDWMMRLFEKVWYICILYENSQQFENIFLFRVTNKTHLLCKTSYSLIAVHAYHLCVLLIDLTMLKMWQTESFSNHFHFLNVIKRLFSGQTREIQYIPGMCQEFHLLCRINGKS